MEIKGWNYYNHAAIPSCWPHETPELAPVRDGSIWNMSGKPLFARWTTDFDCGDETLFYYCIKDDLLDLSALKAKRRYEITRALRNFTARPICSEEYAHELYLVYVDSLQGYGGKVHPVPEDSFQSTIRGWMHESCVLFGVFDRESGALCGYADIYRHGRYLPISSLKTRPECEKAGVNFALVYGILEHFSDEIRQGAYLCDGARNVLHQTNFQEFLIKYFQFRKAYCRLHIVYRRGIGLIVRCLFPFRRVLKHLNHRVGRSVYSVLKMEAWQRGLPE